MIDERIEAIVHEEIDGVATARDRARLLELLEQDPDLRAFYEDMKGLTSAMNRIRMEEPPPALKANVLRFVAAHRPEAAGISPVPDVGPAWLRRLGEVRETLQRRPAWGGGLVFASGLAAGILIFSLMTRSPVLETRDLTGTMTPVTERYERIAGRSIEFQGLRGTLETGVSPEGRAVHLDLRSDREAEITVGFEGRPQAFRGFFQLQPEAGLVSFDPGGLRILHRGENRYLLTLSGDESLSQQVTIRIRIGGELLEERLPVIRD